MFDEASQRRVVVKAGAATAHPSAGGVAVVIEGLRDVYELHWAFLIVAALLGVVELGLPHLLSGLIGFIAGAAILLLTWAFEHLAFQDGCV